MIRLTVMYPNVEDAYFDMDYYQNKHIALVKETCGDVVKECSIEQGLGGPEPGSSPTYLVIARLTFDSMEDFETYVVPHDPEFIADVPNFTNIKPVFQINEVIV
jgi:uncharacterized protein (TIGR02118 family)